MLRLAVLASGSKANATYVASQKTSLLIDCGLSAKQAAIRLEALDILPESIDHILVTHEHTDHITGVLPFARRFGAKVHAITETIEAVPAFQGKVNEISGWLGEQFFGDLKVDLFPVSHDARCPVGVRVTSEPGARVLVSTDLGSTAGAIETFIKGCHATVLEFNHDETLLALAPYHDELKRRIMSETGHISNDVASRFLADMRRKGEIPNLKLVICAHVSQEANFPELAKASCFAHWPDKNVPIIYPAAQDSPTPLWEVSREGRIKRIRIAHWRNDRSGETARQSEKTA